MEGVETGSTSKEKYLEVKKKARKGCLQAKCKAERKIFGNVMRRDDQKCDVFKIAKKMVKTNQDIIAEQCIRNDDGVPAASNEDKKIAWNSYHEKLLNTEFAWDMSNLFQVDTVSGYTLLNRQRHG